MNQFPLGRSCGVLLHPTSLPGPAGTGDLGEAAFRFIDFLATAHQGIWQMLPLGPAGAANSPYDCRSAFAGNPVLIALPWLADHELLTREELGLPGESSERADFASAWQQKEQLLRLAYHRLCVGRGEALPQRFAAFQAKQAHWLDDFCLYQTLRDAHDHASWVEWEPSLVRRDPATIERWRSRMLPEIQFHAFVQFVFEEQWSALHRYALDRNVRIVGDIPIYVSYDSADVWSNQELFLLNPNGTPSVLAGVPPDYFAADGQLWGNPCYRWDAVEQNGFRWWVERFVRTLAMVDMARVDHFRGFLAGWHVPAGEVTARNGRWQRGPGLRLFERLSAVLGPLPIIVEDLGIITDDVHQLRDQLGLPGMKVLQFAFGGGDDNPYLPHNYEPNCVVYTGTHDNDTTEGWFEQLDAQIRARVLRYLGDDHGDIVWSLMRLAYASVARLAIIPAQDILGLGSDARMNVPGTVGGNWEWRARPDAFSAGLAERLRLLADEYGRAATHGTEC